MADTHVLERAVSNGPFTLPRAQGLIPQTDKSDKGLDHRNLAEVAPGPRPARRGPSRQGGVVLRRTVTGGSWVSKRYAALSRLLLLKDINGLTCRGWRDWRANPLRSSSELAFRERGEFQQLLTGHLG